MSVCCAACCVGTRGVPVGYQCVGSGIMYWCSDPWDPCVWGCATVVNLRLFGMLVVLNHVLLLRDQLIAICAANMFVGVILSTVGCRSHPALGY